MPRSRSQRRWFYWWDKVAVAAVIVTIIIGVALGGAGATTMRSALQGLAFLAFSLVAVAMIADGQWRFVKSPLWFLPVGVFFWAALQYAIPGSNLRLPTGLEVSADSISWNRYATLQFAGWSFALLLLMVAVAQSFRTVARVKALLAIIAGLFVMVGVFATLQTAVGNQSYLGLWSAKDKKLSLWIRDWVGTESAIGSRSYQTWVAASESKTAEGEVLAGPRLPWYRPENRSAGFGTFVNAEDWSAGAVLILPLMLACSAMYFRRQPTVSAWGLDNYRGWWYLAGALLLATGVGWFANPITAIGTTLFTWLMLLWLASSLDRPFLFRTGLLALTIVAGTATSAIIAKGGIGRLQSAVDRMVSDNQALLRICGDHLATGCGLGSLGELLPAYRSAPAEIQNAGSALFALLAQAGIGLVPVVLLAMLLAWNLYRQVAQTLAADAHGLLVGLLTSLAGWLLLATLSPGADAPAVLLLLAVLLACAIRGLASAHRLPERAYQT